MYEVGDKVRIVDNYIEEMASQGAMDKWLGKVMTICKNDYGNIYKYKMEEDKDENLGFGWNWSDKMIAGLAETIIVEIDPIDKTSAYKTVDDAISRYKRNIYRESQLSTWTEEEIMDAVRFSDKMILELHHQYLSPLFYHFSGLEVVLDLSRGDPFKICRVSVKLDDVQGNDDIARCICLCEVTGHPIPRFIENKINKRD